MICGPCLGWHGPKVARRAFGPCWAVVSGLRPSTARPGKIPCLVDPARFSPKHDGSVPCRPGTAQLSALLTSNAAKSGEIFAVLLGRSRKQLLAQISLIFSSQFRTRCMVMWCCEWVARDVWLCTYDLYISKFLFYDKFEYIEYCIHKS